MLFYERMKVGETSGEVPADLSPTDTADGSSAVCRLDADDDDRHKMKIELSPELAEVFVFCHNAIVSLVCDLGDWLTTVETMYAGYIRRINKLQFDT